MKKHFKTTLEELLNLTPEGFEETALERICFQLIERAISGDFKSINFIRDTIGQQPFKEMLINEFMLNEEIEKTNSFLLDLKNDESEVKAKAHDIAIAILEQATPEEHQLKEMLYKKCLKLYGEESILAFVQDKTNSFANVDELSETLFGEVNSNDKK